MLLSMLEMLWLGFVMAAVPGPVLFELIRRTLADKQSLLGFLLGNFAGIIIVMFVALSALSLITRSEIITVLYVFSGVFLIYLGVSAILKKNAKHRQSKDSLAAFPAGLFLSTINPTRLALWISLAAQYSYMSLNFTQAVSHGLCVIIGMTCLFLLVILLVHLAEHKVARHLRLISVVCGIILCIYGIATLTQALLH